MVAINKDIAWIVALNLIVALYLAVYRHFVVSALVLGVTILMLIKKQKRDADIIALMGQFVKYIPINITLLDRNRHIIASNIADDEITESVILDSAGKRMIKKLTDNRTTQYFAYEETISVNGEIIGFLQVESDISAMMEYCKRNYIEIRALGENLANATTKRIFAEALENNSDGILILSHSDKNGEKLAPGVIYANKSMLNMLGVAEVDLAGIDIYEIFERSQRERVRAIFDNMISENPVLLESIMLSTSGSFLAEISAHSCDIGGKNALYLSVRNINMRKSLESKRDRNRLLALKDTKITLIVYLLSVLFVKISNHTRLIKEQAHSLTDTQGLDTSEILQGVESIDNTIKDLIVFYTPSGIKSFIDIKSLLERIQRTVFFKEVVNNTVITIIQKGKIDEVYCDEDALKYVFIAIINNSLEGIELNKGNNYYGRINITIGDLDERFILISIEDNAGGIDESMIGRIFDMFYSTKTRSIGLGLSTCKVIVEDILQGSIEAANITDGTKIDIKIAKQ